jgi:hypothetical protein
VGIDDHRPKALFARNKDHFRTKILEGNPDSDIGMTNRANREFHKATAVTNGCLSHTCNERIGEEINKAKINHLACIAKI